MYTMATEKQIARVEKKLHFEEGYQKGYSDANKAMFKKLKKLESKKYWK